MSGHERPKRVLSVDSHTDANAALANGTVASISQPRASTLRSAAAVLTARGARLLCPGPRRGAGAAERGGLENR